jgi:hypothetical protein
MPDYQLVGTVLTKPGHGAIIKPGINGIQYFIIQTKARHDTGAKALYEHIRFRRQSLKDILAFGAFYVECHALTIAIAQQESY